MASKQIKAKKVTASRRAQYSDNRLWLAGLGVVSLTQKRAQKLYAGLIVEGRALQLRARHSAVRFYAVAQTKIHTRLQPIGRKAAEVAAQANQRVDANVNAVLARLGVKPKAASKAPGKAPGKARVARKPRVLRKAAP